jgi:hypothetical protein
MPERKIEMPLPERIVLSEDTMSRRWKFILEEACVAKNGPDVWVAVAGVVFGFLAVALTVVACVAQ